MVSFNQKKDYNDYNDIREKSLMQWLDDMEKHSDIEVYGGVTLAREYIQYLKDQIEELQKQGRLKDEFLKKLKEEKKALKNQG